MCVLIFSSIHPLNLDLFSLQLYYCLKNSSNLKILKFNPPRIFNILRYTHLWYELIEDIMNYCAKFQQQISLFKFVKRLVKEGGYKRGSKKRKKKKRPIPRWYPMAAASWMRIASRGGVSYRRIISATEARRAFSPIFAAVPSPFLFIPRVYFLQRTDPFVYPPSPPRCSDNDGPRLRSSTLFFSNARFFFSNLYGSWLYGQIVFSPPVKNNKNPMERKRMGEFRELNSLIGYWDIFLCSFSYVFLFVLSKRNWLNAGPYLFR